MLLLLRELLILLLLVLLDVGIVEVRIIGIGAAVRHRRIRIVGWPGQVGFNLDAIVDLCVRVVKPLASLVDGIGFGPVTPASAKLTGTPISSPAISPAYNAAQAFDGNFNTFFYAADSSLADWVGLNLGSPQTITQIESTRRRIIENVTAEPCHAEVPM